MTLRSRSIHAVTTRATDVLRRVVEAGVLPEFAKIETDRVLSYLYKTEEARRHTVRQWVIQYETKAPSEWPGAKRFPFVSKHEMQGMMVTQVNHWPQACMSNTDELKGACNVDRLPPA